MRLDFALLAQAVALQLDIEAVAEQALEHVATRPDKMRLPGGNGLIEHTTGAARKRDQPAAGTVEGRELEMCALIRGRYRDRRASDSFIRLR